MENKENLINCLIEEFSKMSPEELTAYIEELEENERKTKEEIETIKFEMVIDILNRNLEKVCDAIETGNMKLIDAMTIRTGYVFRNCIVKAKKSGLKAEREDRKAHFHRWADLTAGVQQVVAIVEFEDGHVEQVKPDRIIFTNDVTDFWYTDVNGEESNKYEQQR